MLSQSVARALAFTLSTISETREAVAVQDRATPDAFRIAVYRRSTRPGSQYPGEWLTELATLAEARGYIRRTIAAEMAQERNHGATQP